jgi:hypothetical protein
MKNLYDLYNECISNHEWNYYNPTSSTGIEVLSDADVSRSFVASYLGKGCKNKVDIFNYIEELSDIRIRHIVSCFFLGVTLYNHCRNIQESINNLLSKISGNPGETIQERFLYVWMLISIFHDFGYAVEDGLKTLEKSEFNELIKRLPPRPRYIPDIYTKKLLKNYNRFRKCRFGVNDHGIVGGIKLYKDLCELREIKEKGDLLHYWGKPIEKDFGIAAWTIACHNVFMVKRGDWNEKCYTCKRMNGLVYDTHLREIKIDKHPFLFLFCLVDTLEPIKTLHNYNLLKKISLEIKSDNIKLDYSKLCQITKKNSCHIGVKMNDWLTDVKEINPGELTIAI